MSKTIICFLTFMALYGNAAAQKGDKSLAAGLLLALPQTEPYAVGKNWHTGNGAEAIGQYNFTNKSSVLLQFQLINFPGTLDYAPYSYSTNFTSRH